MEQQMALMDEMSREMVGKTITVLNEGWDRYAECCFGRSAADAPEIDTKVFFTVEGKSLIRVCSCKWKLPIQWTAT